MSCLVNYIGHSTVHIQNQNLSIITDPVFSRRILFLKRHSPLPLLPNNIGEPSAIFISHAHYDHLDIPSFKYFSSKVPIILPKGLGKLVGRFVQNTLIELTPGSRYEIVPGLIVTAFPVTHFSFRLSGLTYRNALGFFIEMNGTKIFFPGDTAYREDFKKFKHPDLALLPIGPCKPEWIMRGRHLTADEALRLNEEIEARFMIPIHWGTFRLSPEPLNAPIEELKKLVAEKNLQDRVKLLKAGETLEI